MSDSFCNVILKKRFIKCISKNTDTCYIFAGKVPIIKNIIKDIKKNLKENNLGLQNISDESITKLFQYLGGDINKINFQMQKDYIKNELFLDKFPSNKIIFVDELINDDDTNEMIINKIISKCYKGIIDITEPYIYAWYEDNRRIKRPLTFIYEDETIEYEDFLNKSSKESIDNNLINLNGDRNPKQSIDLRLTLYEKHYNPKNVIYFLSLDEYLEKKNMFDDLEKFTEEQIKNKIELKSFLNGLLFKYWVNLSVSEILSYKTKQSSDIKKNYIKNK